MPNMTQAFAQGTHGARPAASADNIGYYYLETDTNGGTLFQSTGSAWVQLAPGVSSAGGMGFVSMSANHTLTAGNVNVLVMASGLTLTLPAVAAASGQAVAVNVRTGLGSVTVAASSGEHFDGGGTSISVSADMLWCDGTQWYEAAY